MEGTPRTTIGGNGREPAVRRKGANGDPGNGASFPRAEGVEAPHAPDAKDRHQLEQEIERLFGEVIAAAERKDTPAVTAAAARLGIAHERMQSLGATAVEVESIEKPPEPLIPDAAAYSPYVRTVINTPQGEGRRRLTDMMQAIGARTGIFSVFDLTLLSSGALQELSQSVERTDSSQQSAERSEKQNVVRALQQLEGYIIDVADNSDQITALSDSKDRTFIRELAKILQTTDDYEDIERPPLTQSTLSRLLRILSAVDRFTDLTSIKKGAETPIPQEVNAFIVANILREQIIPQERQRAQNILQMTYEFVDFHEEVVVPALPSGEVRGVGLLEIKDTMDASLRKALEMQEGLSPELASEMLSACQRYQRLIQGRKMSPESKRLLHERQQLLAEEAPALEKAVESEASLELPQVRIVRQRTAGGLLRDSSSSSAHERSQIRGVIGALESRLGQGVYALEKLTPTELVGLQRLLQRAAENPLASVEPIIPFVQEIVRQYDASSTQVRDKNYPIDVFRILLQEFSRTQKEADGSFQVDSVSLQKVDSAVMDFYHLESRNTGFRSKPLETSSGNFPHSIVLTEAYIHQEVDARRTPEQIQAAVENIDAFLTHYDRALTQRLSSDDIRQRGIDTIVEKLRSLKKWHQEKRTLSIKQRLYVIGLCREYRRAAEES